MAKKVLDVMPKSSNGTEPDVDTAPSPVIEEPVVTADPTPGGDPAVSAVDDPVADDGRGEKNQVLEYKRKMEDALAERDRYMGVAQELATRQPQPQPVAPELPGTEVLAGYGMDAPVTGAMDERTLHIVDQRMAAARFQTDQERQADLNNEATLNVVMSSKDNEDLKPYTNEMLMALRSLAPQLKVNPGVVPWVMNQIRGQHHAELLDAAVKEARAQGAQEREIIGGSPSSTKLTVAGQEIDLEPGELKTLEDLCARYNSRLSDSEQKDPKKVMTPTKWMEAKKRTDGYARADTSQGEA